VQFGLITDRKLCPDPEEIISRFEPEFNKLVTSLMWLENGYVGAHARAFDAMLSDAKPSGAPAKKATKRKPATKTPAAKKRKTVNA
jgi:hypothetical protein